jgi:hypothetical protein
LIDSDDFAAEQLGRFYIDAAVAKLAGVRLGTCMHVETRWAWTPLGRRIPLVVRCEDMGVEHWLFGYQCPKHQQKSEERR